MTSDSARTASAATAVTVPRRRGAGRLEVQRGQGMVEYGLILILIAVVVIIVVGVVGHQVNNAFSNLSSQLGS
jgi:pilus assembly protein Flp/PilA